jgi:hypothetical protein
MNVEQLVEFCSEDVTEIQTALQSHVQSDKVTYHEIHGG